jgi:nicotinate-nucleotide pyrophosphorylase (carboxylating)
VRALPEPYASHLPPLLAAAFAEDLPDLTGTAVFTAEDRAAAVLIAKDGGVVCGAPAFGATFSFLDDRCVVETPHGDGDAVARGAEIARILGSTRALLAAERTALNFVRRLSGIATLTRRFVDAIAGTNCHILDTRKTTPGWRALEKHAVRCGGGTNHRMGLYDAAMLKDTHLAAAGSLGGAVERVRSRWGSGVPLIVECTTMAQVEEALASAVEHIMLDNMDPTTMREAVRVVAGRAKLEASGGVTLENVRAIAATGVDFVSVGALTHSAPALDFSLEVRR